MILHLIRHGKTEANENKLFCGVTDIPLHKNGILELLEFKKELYYPTAELYIVSGLLRTVQTANILFDNPTLTVINELCEINFGDFEMQSYEQLKSTSAYQNWVLDIDNLSPPNGESKKMFIERVIEGFSKVKDLLNTTSINSCVIVTHGGVIATIMEHLFPNEKNFYQWQPACGKGYTLSIEDNITKYNELLQ